MIRALIAVAVLIATLALAYEFPDDAIRYYVSGAIVLALPYLGTAPIEGDHE